MNEEIKETKEVKAEPVTKKKPAKNGVVVGADKLRIRSKSSLDSDVLAVIDKGTKLIVYGSSKDFYRVSYKCDGIVIQGYCLKNYISVEGE